MEENLKSALVTRRLAKNETLIKEQSQLVIGKRIKQVELEVPKKLQRNSNHNSKFSLHLNQPRSNEKVHPLAKNKSNVSSKSTIHERVSQSPSGSKMNMDIEFNTKFIKVNENYQQPDFGIKHIQTIVPVPQFMPIAPIKEDDIAHSNVSTVKAGNKPEEENDTTSNNNIKVVQRGIQHSRQYIQMNKRGEFKQKYIMKLENEAQPLAPTLQDFPTEEIEEK